MTFLILSCFKASKKLAVFDNLLSKKGFGPMPCLCSHAHGSETKNTPQFLWCLAAFPPQGDGVVPGRSFQTEWHPADNLDVLGTDWKFDGAEANPKTGENLQGFRPKAAARRKIPSRISRRGITTVLRASPSMTRIRILSFISSQP